MITDKYPPLNVLSIMKGFDREGLQHQITPYRIQLKSGEAHKVKEIRQVTWKRVGGKLQFRYTVVTDNDSYYHILFDTHTFTWRLIKIVKNGIVEAEYGLE